MKWACDVHNLACPLVTIDCDLVLHPEELAGFVEFLIADRMHGRGS